MITPQNNNGPYSARSVKKYLSTLVLRLIKLFRCQPKQPIARTFAVSWRDISAKNSIFGFSMVSAENAEWAEIEVLYSRPMADISHVTEIDCSVLPRGD